MKAIRDEMPGVSFSVDWRGNHYTGTAEALAAARLLTVDQLPGQPGMPSTATTYVDGVRQPRNARPVHDDSFKRITKIGRRFEVIIGFSDEERAHREQAKEEEREARARIKPEPGFGAAEEAARDASALFKVGDSVTLWHGAAAVISRGFGIHRVNEDDGEYELSNGKRGSYKPGYVIQYRNGETSFVSAEHLVDADGSPTHLRLAGGTSVRAQRPTMSLRG